MRRRRRRRRRRRVTTLKRLIQSSTYISRPVTNFDSSQ
jgi:hypothetical protein